jgi:hypothetical protein
MSYNLTTSGSCISKAGSKSNISGCYLYISDWCDKAEGDFCADTRRNWVVLSGATIAVFRGAISDAVSDLVGMKIINWDMSGFTSRSEAQTMLDVLRDDYTRIVNICKEDENKEVMTTS